jgi:hypothetical protein
MAFERVLNYRLDINQWGQSGTGNGTRVFMLKATGNGGLQGGEQEQKEKVGALVRRRLGQLFLEYMRVLLLE